MNKLPLIEKGSQSNFKFNRRTTSDGFLPLAIFVFAIVIIFVTLTLRLFQLTIVKGDYYARLAEENRIREIVIEPQRGKIIDRGGVTLVENKPANPNQSGNRYFSPRIYTNPEAIAPFVGYRQLADQQDLASDLCLNKAQPGDKVGKKGIEKIFDCDLRGKLGKKLIELDARGKYVKTLSIVQPTNGKTLQISLDLNLQKKAQELLKDKKGVIVAVKPKTGEILAFYSSPTFNSQDFEDNNQAKINEYLKSKDQPLFNRITEGAYPPGSIFKLFVATGGLEDKTIDEKTEFEDKGTIQAGPTTFGNWYFLEYGKTEGLLNIVKAIRRSTDTFFYQLGAKMGPERIKYWASRFGLGRKSNLPMNQAEGTLPSPYWKEETLKENWYLGDTYNMSIGQGYILVTPLQIVQATAAFANNGKMCQLQLLKNAKSNCLDLGVSSKTMALVREGMKEACSTGGTGWPFFNYSYRANPTASNSATINVQTACKTGTAEDAGKNVIAHAWITVFAPYDNPEIALTVLIEHGGQGSDVAGPVAKQILQTYFEEKK